MEIDVTVQFVPIFWGMVAVMLALVGALLACIDPEIIEVYLSDASRRSVSAAAMLAAAATLLVVHGGIAHELGALLSR